MAAMHFNRQLSFDLRLKRFALKFAFMLSINVSRFKLYKLYTRCGLSVLPLPACRSNMSAGNIIELTVRLFYVCAMVFIRRVDHVQLS